MLKIISRFSKKDFALLGLSIFCMILSVAFDLIQPILFGWMAGTLSQSPGAWDPSYGIFSGVMVGAAIGGITTNIIAVFLSVKITVRLSKKMRFEMFNKVQYLASADIDKVSISSIINRINNDVMKVEQLMFLLFTMFVKAPTYFIGGLTLSIASLFTSISGDISGLPTLGNIAYIYILFPLLSILTFFILYKAFPIFDREKLNQDDNNSIMSENLIGSRVVRAFNLEKNQIGRFGNKSSELRMNSIKGGVIVQVFMPIFLLCMNLAIVFIIGYSGFISSNLDPAAREKFVGVVTSIIQYFNILTIGFYLLAFVLVMYSATSVSARRINEIYALENSIVESSNPLKIKNNNISFKNVWFKYFEDSKEWAISDLSFDIKEGETIGIIGQTGSGKSTIVNLLTRLYDVSKGEITIGDHNIKEIEIKEIRDKIRVSLQEKILLAGTIEENIKVGKQNATSKEVKDAAIMAEAYEFIKEKEGTFKYKIEERGRNLSGGQKQRVSIARALISKPEILIFDDSTSALDNITEKKLLQNIKKGLKNSTLIIVAQRINSIKDADKILVLSDGELIGSGNHKYLMKNNETYKSIYNHKILQRNKNEKNTKGWFKKIMILPYAK